MRVLWLGLLFLAACAHAPRLPSEGTRWLELSSPSFVMHTDLPEPRAVGILKELEATLDGYLATVWKHLPRPPLRMRLVMLASRGEYESFELAARAFSFPLASEQVMVAFPRIGDAVLKQALAFSLSRALLPSQPQWLSYGMAHYLATSRYKDGLFVVGKPNHDLQQFMNDFGRMPVGELVRDQERRADDEPQDARFRAAAWLLVHYLMSHEPGRLACFEQALGAGATGLEAWRTCFGDASDAQWDSRLTGYWRKARYAFQGATPATRSFEPGVRPMDDAEAGALCALLALEGGYEAPTEAGWWRSKTRSQEYLKRASQVDATLPLAVLVKHSLREWDAGIRRRDVELAVERHPDDWLAHYLYVRELGWEASASELWNSLERGLKLRPLEPSFNFHMARILRERNHVVEADGFSAVAARLAPFDADILMERGAILGELGRCDELALLHRRLREQPPDDLNAHAELSATLAEQESACKLKQ